MLKFLNKILVRLNLKKEKREPIYQMFIIG